jgi:hypothetical protein
MAVHVTFVSYDLSVMFDVIVCRCEDIVEGEPAELLVLSQDDTFFNFKVRRQQQQPSFHFK